MSALVAFATLGGAAPAQATIVWQGREVSAWPDLPDPSVAPSGGLQAATKGIHLFPHPSGVVRGLTILVDFSDQSSAYNKEEIDAWLNAPGYSKFGLKGSVRDFFLKQSNNKVDFQNEVHGFYRAQKPKSYYQGGTAYERADELWAEVVAALDAEIDFSKFDNDKDGQTDAISLLYAGNEGTFGKGLWPHASGSNDRRDNVRLSRYMMTALNNQPANYVFAHESGHMLFGWPDLYGVGDYCIMANRVSDNNPVGINDAYRADQGWIEFVDITSTTNARHTAVPDGVVYRFLNTARPSEYFLWSNVQNTDEWAPLKGGGLLVWHFDKTIRSNDPPGKLHLAVVQAAAGSRQLSSTTWPSPGSAGTDLYSQSVNAQLSPTTQPKSSWNDGATSGLRIYDISASGPSMQFSVGTGTLPPGGTGGSGSGGAPSAGSGGKAANGGSAGMASGGASSGGKSGGAGGGAGTTGAGGTAGSGGGGSGGLNNGGANSGGVPSAGGNATSSGGSTMAMGGSIASGGANLGSGGALGLGGTTGAGGASGGAPSSRGDASGGGGAGNGAMPPPQPGAESGCSCRTTPKGDAGGNWSSVAMMALVAWRLRRRRSQRRSRV